MRLFVAAVVPSALRSEIALRVARLRGRVAPASWPSEQTLHLTLAFLGETREATLEALLAELGTTELPPAVPARIGGPGFFPDAKRPRVGWLGIEPEEPLRAIASAVRAAAVRAGAAAMDARPFRAHLTLARLRSRWREADVTAFRAAFDAWHPEMPIDRVVLFESRLSSRGATHLPLLERSLIEPPPAAP
ncbi:MAG TPA: RNA 2',3'-cyclic phosphodiesterase [Thermoanaerobaculia bacterium]|nr:RNA 2',3'-cyclic phosphodiesterase [Thermoanaerobaculia bacterium]